MTDPNYTALLLVIDRSGSMTTIRDDMVGGLTSMIATQAEEPGMLTVDIVTFDTEIELTHHLAAPADVVIRLEPRGGTALYDAIGVAVNGFGTALAALPEHARPETVQVVIVTDGEENSSGEYTAATVRAIIAEQTEKYGWDFAFLGANQDAILAAQDLGIDADSAMTFDPAPHAVHEMNVSVGRYVSSVRSKQKLGFTDGERASSRRTE